MTQAQEIVMERIMRSPFWKNQPRNIRVVKEVIILSAGDYFVAIKPDGEIKGGRI
jgi:hypothetical protein